MSRIIAGFVRWGWHDGGTQRGMGREHAVNRGDRLRLRRRAALTALPLALHGGRGRGTDMRYVYSPLRGLVDVQGNE